jgi:hypothetical protein
MLSVELRRKSRGFNIDSPGPLMADEQAKQQSDERYQCQQRFEFKFQPPM